MAASNPHEKNTIDGPHIIEKTLILTRSLTGEIYARHTLTRSTATGPPFMCPSSVN
jgi:hypothetical protein